METNNDNYRSPIIREVDVDKERLIDTGMLHFESSVAGYNERYHRGETSHTIHVWWARRPHSAMRSLVYSSLCKDKSDKALDVMSRLAMSCDKNTLMEANDLILKHYNSIPKTLDMFGGGGTIPFESKRLGLDSYSIDSNQMSVFIQKCNMLYADSIDLDEAVKNIETIGLRILNNLKEKTNWLYPLRKKEEERLFGYTWTYKIECPHCGKKLFISKRPWLSKKKGKHTGFVLDNTVQNESFAIKEDLTSDEVFSPAWERYIGVLRCNNCSKVIEDVDVLECDEVMTAFIKNKESSGKEFVLANQDIAIPEIEKIEEEELKLLKRTGFSLPKSELPVWSGVVNPALYGIRTHADFLNKRQRLLLLYLIENLALEFDELAEQDLDMAKFVIGALSSLIDQVVDWNSRLSMWIPQNEQVGRGFCGPGIAMLFDYVETDQLLKGPANLWDKLKRIIKGVKSFENCNGNITIRHAHAQELPFENNFFDAIITDPPYYDNIYYSILADFFYAWKKILLEKIEPDLFLEPITDYSHELVASSRRVDEGESAHEAYCNQLNLAFTEASRVLKDDGVYTFVYSHSSVNGWEAVIRAYRQSDFYVSSVQPLSIERKGRPRAVLSQAVNTCMAIVARKEKTPKTIIDLKSVLESTGKNCKEFGEKLTKDSGWNEADAGLAIIACTVGMLANTSGVEGIEDTDVLLAASKIVKQYFPGFSIKVRDSI